MLTGDTSTLRRSQKPVWAIASIEGSNPSLSAVLPERALVRTTRLECRDRPPVLRLLAVDFPRASHRQRPLHAHRLLVVVPTRKTGAIVFADFLSRSMATRGASAPRWQVGCQLPDSQGQTSLFPAGTTLLLLVHRGGRR